MDHLTGFVLRHRLAVVLGWLAVAVLGVLTAGAATGRMTNTFSMPGPGVQANARIVALYHSGGGQPPLVPVVTAPAGTSLADPAAARIAARIIAAARIDPAFRLTDYAGTGDRAFLTRDGRSTFALLFTPPTFSMTGTDPVPDQVQRALTAAAPPGWQVGLTGSTVLAQPTGQSQKGNGVLVETLLGGIGALVVLVLLFASFLAIVPLLVAAISVLGTFVLVLGLTYLTGVSQIVQFLVALIGLGVAIDYSLLIVSRWREERAHGLGNEAAVRAAMQHAGRAVVFSGATVAIGLLALVVLPVPMLRSVGIGGVLVPLVSVAVAITLLPVLLVTVGPRLDWPRLRTERSASRPWSAWARLVHRHRWAAAVAGFAVLAVLILPARSLHLGEPSSAAMGSSGPAAQALHTLERGGVPSGVLTPIEVLATGSTGIGSGGSAPVAASLARLPGVYAVAGAPDAQAGGTRLIDVLPVGEGSQPSGQATVQSVRDALDGRLAAARPAIDQSGTIGVGGYGAQLLDFDHDVYGTFPLMLTLIGLATFVLLARAFRSLLLAAKAVLFNLISLAAAYGVLTWVWQDGHGSNAVWGLPASGAITMWVPLMVFAFLFGLSMDYEVFILSRVREAYDRTGSGRQAVVDGIGRTGRLVTGAALILMLSFLSMSTAPVTDLKILATGLGAGILVDAVVIRCLLVPAMVALFGRWNWWLPRPVARILRVPASVAIPAVPSAVPSAAGHLSSAGSARTGSAVPADGEHRSPARTR